MSEKEKIIENTEFTLYNYKSDPTDYYFARYTSSCIVTFPASSSNELLHYLKLFYDRIKDDYGAISIGMLDGRRYNLDKEVKYLHDRLGVSSNWINREDLKCLIKAVTFLVGVKDKIEKPKKEIAKIIHKIKEFTNKEVR